MPASADTLIDEALRASFIGWDFSWLEGRARESEPDWDYEAIVRSALDDARSVLDIDTGGGEFLARVIRSGRFAVATEGYGPNVTVAHDRLAAIGVPVVHTESAPDNVDQTTTNPAEAGSALPFRDEAFDLVIDRHSSYWPGEVRRVLVSGGRFVTQQRGDAGISGVELRALFGRPHDARPPFDLSFARDQLDHAGFDLVRSNEADTPTVFYDLAALVYYLRAIPWAVEGFDPLGADRQALERIHERIIDNGELSVCGSHMLLDARAR
jgi:SAM-dependent methyltransferase